MPNTDTYADKELTLEEQIERAEHDVECALAHLQELQLKQMNIAAANTDKAFEKLQKSTRKMVAAGYL